MLSERDSSTLKNGAPIGARLKTSEHNHEARHSHHALCVEVIGEELRMLLPHEVDAMIYDVLHLLGEVAKLYKDFRDDPSSPYSSPKRWE